MRIQTTRDERKDAGLELLQILAVLFVVAHNYVVSSGVTKLMYREPDSLRSLFLFVFGAWGKTGINCVLLVAGYRMCRAHWQIRDFVKRYLQLAFYNIAIYLVFALTDGTFSVTGLLEAPVGFLKYTGTGFFATYLLFWLFIPFLNVLAGNMNRKQHLLLIGLCCFMYMVLCTWGSASVIMNCLSWFCVLYLIGAYIRLYPGRMLDSTAVTGVAALGLMALAVFSVIAGATGDEPKKTYYYISEVNKILPVLVSVGLLAFFKNVRIRNRPFISRIAASAMGVWYIHANSDAMRKWLWVDTLQNTEVYGCAGIVIVLHAVLSVLGIYCVCTVIDLLRVALLEKPFFKLCDKVAEKRKAAKTGVKMKKPTGKLGQYLHEFWKYRDLLKLLVTKNIKLKYRRSWLGYVWSILNPLLIMAVMSVVFSTMFKRNIENFPVYLFCGQLLFNFMNTATTQAQFSISGNAALLKKTYVPKYLFTLARVTSCLVDLFFSLGALVIVILVTKAKITWYALLFPFVLVQLYVFSVGLGLFLAQASVFFKDTQFIYSAVITAWLYLTPIFYPLEALNEQLRWIITHLNPMYFYIGQFRDLVYIGRMPEVSLILTGCLTALAVLGIGMLSFLKTKDEFILHI